MELAQIEVNDFGGAPFAEHNMPCPVCRKNHAIIFLNTGTFHPCRKCEASGWVTVKATGWRRWLARRLFGDRFVM